MGRDQKPNKLTPLEDGAKEPSPLERVIALVYIKDVTSVV